MAKFYVEFKTWAEGRIEIPWPYVWFEEVNDYRDRNDLSKPIPIRKIEAAFSSMSEDAAEKFLMQHVPAVILGALIDTSGSHLLAGEIKRVFGYVEILGWQEVVEGNREQIEMIMKSAGQPPGA